jgi:hypothetical protein
MVYHNPRLGVPASLDARVIIESSSRMEVRRRSTPMAVACVLTAVMLLAPRASSN